MMLLEKLLFFCEKINKTNNKFQIKSNYLCFIDYELEQDKIIITINTYPKINIKGVRYKLEFKDIYAENYMFENHKIFIVNIEYKNKTAISTVLKNNDILCKAEKKIEIKDKNFASLYVKNRPKK